MEESEEIKKVVHDSMDAWMNGDGDYWMKFVSKEKGTVLTGTDPNEWWEGYDKIVEDFKKSFYRKKKFTWTGEFKAYKEGSVGWAMGKVVLHRQDGSKFPYRQSGVLRLEDGQWKIVQNNIAIEVPNDKIKMVIED